MSYFTVRPRSTEAWRGLSYWLTSDWWIHRTFQSFTKGSIDWCWLCIRSPFVDQLWACTAWHITVNAGFGHWSVSCTERVEESEHKKWCWLNTGNLYGAMEIVLLTLQLLQNTHISVWMCYLIPLQSETYFLCVLQNFS